MANVNNRLKESLFQHHQKFEHDACGIISVIEKKNIPTRANIDHCIDALITMNHRAGFINHEGDGAGIHIDIPRELWKKKFKDKGLQPDLVDNPQLIIGHFFINKVDYPANMKAQLKAYFSEHAFTVVYESDETTNSDALGPIALQEEPVFWQIALLPKETVPQLDALLFAMTTEIEKSFPVHIASLSPDHAVYKVMGAGDTLRLYYKDLQDPLAASAMTLGHNRYSTNTLSNFFRVQPFSVLGHNGEINTIAKLRDEAQMLDVPLADGGSDSQDLNKTVETLVAREHYSLFEAMDIIFPPIINEIKAYPKHLQDLYTYLREAWGHFAQGPAGIISRYKNEAVFSVDSLGLRPLWQLETETSYFFSSEPGIMPSTEYVAEPKPLSPGEKVGLSREKNKTDISLYPYHEYQQEVYERISKRLSITDSSKHLIYSKYPTASAESLSLKVHNGMYAAFGWEREQIQLVEQMAEKGAEPIRSLGHDAPLAAIHQGRKNIADFIKESVAVVTNPAIDRDREAEHFSTRMVVGKRPDLFQKSSLGKIVELTSPLLIEGKAGIDLSEAHQQPSYEQLIEAFQQEEKAYHLSITFSEEETLPNALDRLVNEAVAAVEAGAELLILNDAQSHTAQHLWIDPHLALAVIDQGLKNKHLRRSCSLLLRSGAVRSLHDIIVAIGLGADIISPYIMFATVFEEKVKPLQNLFEALNKGLEKVISTIGIHELRGYGRLFSAIGLHKEMAERLNVVNYFGAEHLAYSFAELKKDSLARALDYENEKARPEKLFHLFPRIWKAIGDIARGNGYDEYREKLAELEVKSPLAIRHLTELKQSTTPVATDKVNIGVKNHSLPFVISSMSFGSQNEIAFRAYAEAADRLNMVSLNGEGGEIKDMLGKYPHTRGQQIASGRFGVNAELLNSSNLLEIKIGQGAKPGEGGHLPGSKVTAKIAEARNATIGSDLISPSNNHDIYSIEDLAQMITELKTANDQAKVAVKVPVVPNIGTIAVGIAKAGADIITVSGFDGGTGAARIHALQHVGLPVEIGVKAAHNALLEAGMRKDVEIWADGGIKSALDVIKVMLLGANRIGFGTLSMIAIGCTTCRGCHLDSCHVGIATQIESEAEAKEHGLRRFVPRQLDLAVEGLTRLFTAFGEELKQLTGSLGFENAQDIVGRSDLLEQTRGLTKLDLTSLLERLEVHELAHSEAAAHHADSDLAVAVGAEYLDADIQELTQSREYASVTSEQRVLGSRVSCHRVRDHLDGSYKNKPVVSLKYKNGSIPGNGLGAYNTTGIHIHVDGGAQDGIGKTAYGGRIFILKDKGKNGAYYNGSVGKGFGYGAQQGSLFIQGNADSRAGIRLSGADILIGGTVEQPLPAEEHGNLGVHANIKGFAFEYMTNGRGLVLGDPGPWICAGMTGGVVYLRHQPEMGLTKDALQRRIAKGAKVTIQSLTAKGIQDVTELLTDYANVLKEHEQFEAAATIHSLIPDAATHFLQVIPMKEQADPAVSTE